MSFSAGIRSARTAAGVTLAAFLAGCTNLGPKTVAVDRFDYSTAIAESWKDQTLLNIVKMRYMDLPVFVDVASIVAGYSLQSGVSATGVLSSNGAVQGNYGSIGGQAVFTDRPTITYVPLTGEKFLRGLVTPIDPKNIFFMLQSGYAADFILGLTVEGLNGVRNRSNAGGAVRLADPDFLRAIRLLRDLQIENAIGMRVEEDKDKGSTAVLFFRSGEASEQVVEKAAEIRRLLRVATDQHRLVLVYSPMPGADNELAVSSRSMLQILGAFASYVDVPESHVQAHRVIPSFDAGASPDPENAVRIYSGEKEPENAFASVRYRDHWFWVDDGDWRTKRALTAVIFFFTLAETGSAERLPLITIPAQ